jgi:DNA mismatch repair protein MutS
MGDFYELFYDDAVKAAQLLELTLTSRNKNAENPIPMAGVPHKAVMEYVEKLVNLGYKVALADQLENPKDAVGIVKRAVTQVITPGTTIDTLSTSDNNFLVAFDKTADGEYRLAYVDLATGEFKQTELADFAAVCGEIASLRAREVVAGYELSEEERAVLTKQLNLLISEEFDGNDVAEKLMSYVKRTQLRDLTHIQAPVHYERADFLQMDYASKSALELTVNKRDGKKFGTLYGLLDMTKTAMGTRMLKAWIERPLIDLPRIQKRQEIIATFLTNFFERADLIEALKGVYDLERLASRVSFGKAVPVDLLQLANSLSNVPAIRNILKVMGAEVLSDLAESLDEIPELSSLIHSAIDENAMRIITEGEIIKKGYNAQLDKYREALTEGNSWRLELEVKEREKTEISGLKIEYNRQDGYYFHVTASQIDRVPPYFIYKKALKNATRYTTAELEKIESTLLEAREKSSLLEYDLFQEVRDATLQYIPRLQALAAMIAEIDCLQSLASVAEKYQYIRPVLTAASQDVKIDKGRHPVVEAVMGAQEYVPNDIHLQGETNIQLITGPNMSGKSTYMRQFALLVVMAQIGAYVPAEFAEMPVFDAIFTRIGASDNLIGGESTFMVEMSEANNAIQHATANSLILFDELGRGTATYDGMALAQAIIEYIHDHIQAKTLFATHYHELTSLDKTLSSLTNVHVATLEQNGEVIFLHKISEGPADKSYGIHVAKIAGLPTELLTRADVILQKLENQSPDLVKSDKPEQMELFTLTESPSSEVEEELRKLDLMNLTPLEALNKLADLKGKL